MNVITQKILETAIILSADLYKFIYELPETKGSLDAAFNIQKLAEEFEKLHKDDIYETHDYLDEIEKFEDEVKKRYQK